MGDAGTDEAGSDGVGAVRQLIRWRRRAVLQW